MADSIGSLGLDVTEFEAGLRRADFALSKLAAGANPTTVVMRLLATSIRAVGEGLINASNAAKDFDNQVKAIGNSLGGPAGQSLDALNTKLKTIRSTIDTLGKDKGFLGNTADILLSSHFLGGSGLDDLTAKREAQLKTLTDSESQAKADILEKSKAITEVVRLEAEGMKETAKYQQMQSQSVEERQRIYKEYIPEVAKELVIQQELTLEAQKQKALREQATARNSGTTVEAEQAAKNAALNFEDASGLRSLNDGPGLPGTGPRNPLLEFGGAPVSPLLFDVADERDKDKKEAEMAFFHKQEFESGQRALEEKASRDKMLRDLAIANRQSASDAATQTAIGAATQSGRKPFANELSVRQSFLQRKRAAIANHNDAELNEVNAQEQQALRDAYAAESTQTPGQARADRREEHRRGIEASRQISREEELRKRAANGEDSRAIQDQLEKDRQRAKFGAETDIAKKEANQVRGFTQADSTNLQTIAKAYQDGLK